MQVQILEELESNYEASRTKGRCLLLALGTGKLIELTTCYRRRWQ